MALLTRIPQDHSVRRFRDAAQLRYNEAVRLSLAGDRLAAIYLAGYVAEMLLKAAYFRLAGWLPDQPIGFQDLRAARNHAVNDRAIIWPGMNLHHLAGWRDLLIEVRRSRNSSYKRRFQRTLIARVNAVVINWRPDLRYHTNRPRASEVRVSVEAASWLLTRFSTL